MSRLLRRRVCQFLPRPPALGRPRVGARSVAVLRLCLLSVAPLSQSLRQTAIRCEALGASQDRHVHASVPAALVAPCLSSRALRPPASLVSPVLLLQRLLAAPAPSQPPSRPLVPAALSATAAATIPPSPSCRCLARRRRRRRSRSCSACLIHALVAHPCMYVCPSPSPPVAPSSCSTVGRRNAYYSSRQKEKVSADLPLAGPADPSIKNGHFPSRGLGAGLATGALHA